MATIEATRKWAEGLTMEYTRKIDLILEKLPVRMFGLLGNVAFTGFVTKDKLSLADACAHEAHPWSAGTKWGNKFEYGWFFGDFVIPAEAAGERVVFQADLGECLVFVNGKVAGALDKEHKEITLSRSAKVGEKYQIAIEVYAGHGEVPQNLWVIPEDPTCLDHTDREQKVVKNGAVSIFREEVFQLWMDINTLYGLRKFVPEISWRRAGIDKALKQVCDVLDMEAPLVEFLESVKAARAKAAPALACTNGSSMPTMYGISNSHLDLEWLWTKEETRRKAARTISNQLRLIEEYDDYIYYQTQPWLLESIKNDYPDLYEEVKYWVKQGRFVVDGGMWVQADVNIPSGESLIRQFIQGKRFIKDEFGVDSQVFWLPDSFGVPASLPQILAGCNVPYFVSAKLPWLYNGGDMFPYSNFNWKGTDGTSINGYIINGYNTMTYPAGINLKTEFYKDKEDIPDSMMLFGHGDGGGGATRIHMEYIHREKDLDGLAKVKCSTPMEYFNHVQEHYEIKNTYVGELYFAAHRGTYTTRGKTKLLNRRTEFALRDAELWSALCGYNSKAQTDAMWKKVLFNQFHDIIPGTCMDTVYAVSEGIYEDVIRESCDVVQKAAGDCAAAETISVFNSLSWDRNALVTLPEGYTGVSAQQTQMVDGKVIALLDAPACGSAVYTLNNDAPAASEQGSAPVLENDLIKAIFNEEGELVSLVDNKTGMEFLSGPSNRLRMYKDITGMCDAWDIDSTYEKAELTLDHQTQITDVFAGPLVSGMTIRKKLDDSEWVQKVRLYKGSAVLHFETQVDWQERHKLLKVDFGTNILTEEMISEIQHGYSKRPTHKNRMYDADRFEVLQHRWSALAENNRGVALLNDCKYGISADGSRMSLTLLKSAMAPMPDVDKGVHTFTYALMLFTTNLYDSDVVQQAWELNCPATLVMGGKTMDSAIRVSNKNVVVDTVKLAEDGSGDLIIRLYESMNSRTRCRLYFGFPVKKVYVTDMLENNKTKLSVYENGVEIDVKAFQVITLRVER